MVGGSPALTEEFTGDRGGLPCTAQPSICRGCPGHHRESGALQKDDEELPTTQPSFLVKIQYTGNSPAKWVEPGPAANEHIPAQSANTNSTGITSPLLYLRKRIIFGRQLTDGKF